MMEKIRFRALQISSGLPATVMLEAQEFADELGEYLREEHRYAKQRKEREPEYEHFYDVQIQRWYKQRSLRANNLAWELATRLSQADHVSKEVAYYAVKELVDLPRDEYKGIFVSRPSGELSTVEFARFIQALVIECQTHAPAVDIRDIWILFTDWRFGQEKDPLEGTYAGADDYKEKHPCCEACGRYLLVTDNQGVNQHSGQVAHIVSVGAGGVDADWDWLVLCTKCHLCSQHANGWEDLLTLYPHIKPKVERARERSGKKPLAALTGEPSKNQPAKQDAPTAPAPVAVGPVTEIVTRVFDGEIVGEPVPPEDPEKEQMLERLNKMKKKAASHPGQAELFEPEEKKESVPVAEPKDLGSPNPFPELVGQEKHSAEPPAPSYNEDGTFTLPPDF